MYNDHLVRALAAEKFDRFAREAAKERLARAMRTNRRSVAFAARRQAAEADVAAAERLPGLAH